MKKTFYQLLTLILCIMFSSCDEQPYTYGSAPLDISSLRQWQRVHRPAIYKFFETQVYGRMPEKNIPIRYELLTEGEALAGKAIRREVAMHIEGMHSPVLILMYLPSKAEGAVPAFLGMNFKGNHQINADLEITISENAPKGKELGADPVRGAATSRWPLEMLMDNGYALVTIYRGDVDPDFDDGFQNGIHPLFYAKGQTVPKADEWGTIGAWAWSLSRVMDYLEQDKDIDAKRVAVFGHSRLGKTALWAGATDTRFALVISNDSGCGGAALSSRKHGETVELINKNFPHWFCDNYNAYRNNEEALMVDQQGLLALIAPRPLYVASAVEDDWADPEGEFLAALYASPIYELYGKRGLTGKMPSVNQPMHDGDVAYHIRKGGHDINLYDWTQFVHFADKYFK